MKTLNIIFEPRPSQYPHKNHMNIGTNTTLDQNGVWRDYNGNYLGLIQGKAADNARKQQKIAKRREQSRRKWSINP